MTPLRISLVLALAASLHAQQISGAVAHGWPNGRGSNQPPWLAADGDRNSYTWTTESYTTIVPCYLGLDFHRLEPVNRIRLWKDAHGGISGDENSPKNLAIEYTRDDPIVPIAARQWIRVSGLVNGFAGGELMRATAVNQDGTVLLDAHDSVNRGHGWASLTFDGVEATAVRIGFARTTFNINNHYKVHEFEAHWSGSAALISFGTGCSGSAGTLALAPVGGALPWVGEPFPLEMNTIAPGAIAAFCLIGESSTAWGTIPLPLDLGSAGMPGCVLLVSPSVLLPMAITGGAARVTPVIPADGALRAAHLYLQGLVADPGANVAGLALSQALDARLGHR